MSVRRTSLVLAVVFLVSACGGGGGVPMPIPTPTPTPPGGTGTVIGSVVISATRVLEAAAAPVRPVRSTLGRPVFVPDQLMVKFRPGVASAAEAVAHRAAGATVLRTIERLGVQVVRLAPGVSAEAAMAAYRASGLIEYVEQDKYAYALIVPTDPLYGSQWHYPQINLPSAWDVTTGGAVIVAVLDTGTRFDHPDLSGVHVTGYDFVTDPDNGDGNGRDPDPTDPGCPGDPTDPSHGAHVEGTIAARTNNGAGVAGVNWGGISPTRIMTLRVLGGCGTGTYADIADAIPYAADHGAKVINMSLGGSSGSSTVDSAIAYARGLGVTLVAAAGNDNCGPVLYPARNANVVAVAATTITNARASYSNCGPELDVAAPGGSGGTNGVLSTSWSPSTGNGYWYFSGTSIATPHVAGLVALMISRGITGPANIQTNLQNTATCLPPGGSCPNTQFGWGLVNASAAVGGGTATSRLRAFSGVISGSTIIRQSDIVEVRSDGTFTITAAQTGTKSVFVWQDLNGNGSVDGGDTYGRVDGVVINPGATTPVGAVTVSNYSGPPIAVTP